MDGVEIRGIILLIESIQDVRSLPRRLLIAFYVKRRTGATSDRCDFSNGTQQV